jgi:hypothetical protein
MDELDASQGQDQTTKETDKPQNRGALTNRPPGIPDNPPPPTEGHNPNNPQWWRRLDSWRFVAEVLILAITIKIACIYSSQLTQMIESNNINREALQSVQRAFVSQTDIQQTRLKGGNVYWDFSFVFENSGQTHATTKVGDLHIEELPNEPDGEQFIGTKPSLQGTLTIPTKGPTIAGVKSLPETLLFGSQFGQKITAEDWGKIRMNQNIRAWGWILYRDVFLKTPVHLTEFSLTLGSARLEPNGDVVIGFRRSNTHNCDDKDCEDYETIVKRFSK